MKIQLLVDYRTEWGQTLYVTGSDPLLGSNDLQQAKEMTSIAPNKWFLELDLDQEGLLEYNYLIKVGSQIVREEHAVPHYLLLKKKNNYLVNDIWYDIPKQRYFATSAFTDVFFSHSLERKNTQYAKTLLFSVYCPYVASDEELALCGSVDSLGNWNAEKAPRLNHFGRGTWQLSLDMKDIQIGFDYKLVICDKKTGAAKYWEDMDNRSLDGLLTLTIQNTIRVISLSFVFNWLQWRTAGVAILVFSLRTADSFGVGEFSDLKKLTDWGASTGMKMIQLLPVNDTTITRTWTDSYPYNAISTYALHPIYLGLKQFPLKDAEKNTAYLKEAEELNDLKAIDYEKVLNLKERYLQDLYVEQAAKLFKTKSYLTFYEQNEYWLFPYACFSYFRDLYGSPNYHLWGKYENYDRKKLEKLLSTDKAVKEKVHLYIFVQYLLDLQLRESRDYAHEKGLILKGDIPIGISANSVEAWVEPHLFNLDVQTGAPPDDFSFYGQNWGFPTYNWEEMAKDGYEWWKKRFRKMSDYFDAYRIDHILGFFRIWEIPMSSVQGLLGYFSPALPFTEEEIRGRGMWFDDYRMTNPYIHEHFLYDIFGTYKQEVIHSYLHSIAYERYELNENCNTQKKIQKLFNGLTDEKSLRIRDGLYSLCNEVLFIRDKREPHKLHPRITAQYSYSYRHLDDETKGAFNRLYDHFFYRRHDRFWEESAMSKLPELIAATRMLVCGEDLGMIPHCVPQVMQQLQILSLEIERMPKDKDEAFTPLYRIPYASVCTTSTHDMSTLRLWWRENREMTQRYYNHVLGYEGLAPEDCSGELCRQILSNHLTSPAMLVVLPFQDWLSFDEHARNPEMDAERINVPANAQHYWRYRMHLSLEELMDKEPLNLEIRRLIHESGR